MNTPFIFFTFASLVVCRAVAVPLPTPVASVALDSEQAAFFESKVRPLLIEHCYECHGDKKQKGGLRLDSMPGWQTGGDSGPVIVPGQPDTSLLIDAILRNDTPVIMAVTFVFSCLVIFFNLIADILYGWLDPRISYR